MFAIDGVLGVLLLGFWLWALIDCIVTPKDEVRNLPKVLWVVLIVLLWVIGAVAWTFLGRTPKARREGGRNLAPETARRPARRDDLPVQAPPATPQHITDARSAELDRQIEAWEAEQRKDDAGA